MGYRVEELAITSELNVATIRYYQRLGLLPPPSRQGRIGLYEEHHLLRLREIRRLVDLGFSLSQIGSVLSGDDPLAAILIERTEGGETVTREELIEESGLSPELVDLAVEFGLLHPVGGPVGGPIRGPVGEPVGKAVRESGDSYPRLALEMLRASAALLEEGIDQNALIDLALRYAEHTENTISEAIDVFRQAIPSADVGTRRNAQLEIPIDVYRQAIPPEDGDENESEGESEHGREGGEDGREEREERDGREELPGEEMVVREEEREERDEQEEREQLAALTQRILPHVLRLISSHFHLTLLRQIGERAQISAPAPVPNSAPQT